MKKLLSVLVVGVTLSLLPGALRAGVGIDLNQGFHTPGDSRLRETARGFGFNVDVGDDMTVGYFFEEALGEWKGDVAAALPNTVNLSSSLNGLRLMKNMGRFVSVGMDIGSAQVMVRSVSGTNTTLAGAAGFNQTKPFADVLAGLRYMAGTQKGISTSLQLLVGYRFLDLNDITTQTGTLAAAGSGESTIDDMNSLMVKLGVQVMF